MSRLKRYTHSVLSGYVLLGTNAVYTFASVPLALRYLSKPEFGLWALTSTIAQYVSLIDLGMAGASRILIDYKDQKDQGEFGGVIKTFLLVSVVQSLCILVIGLTLTIPLTLLLHIPTAQEHEFILLTIGQCAILAAVFLTRICGYLLAAHQRYDISNLAQAVGLGSSLGVLWLGFSMHQGVFSTLWAQAASWAITATVSLIAALKLRLFPSRHCWGHATWARFRELFSYGRDIFLMAVGSQLLNASQTLVLTRILGLEVAAVWSVCTRTYFFIGQIIYRLLDFSAPVLAEMIVRNEMERLCRRFKSLLVTSASLAIVAGVFFAACNQPFVRLWTHGKMSWPQVNDALLGIWLVLLSATRCHTGLVGQTKQIHGMRFLYLVEGGFFVCLSLCLVASGGVTAMLAAGIAGTLLISWPYGSWRTSRYFGLPWSTVAFGWWRSPLCLALCLAPLVTIIAFPCRSLSDRLFLSVFPVATGLVTLPLFLRFGLEGDLRKEALNRFAHARFLPAWLRNRTFLQR